MSDKKLYVLGNCLRGYVGANFGTSGAIIVQNASSTPISGTVGGASSLSFSFDYDGNAQRGTSSKGTDAPITVVAYRDW